MGGKEEDQGEEGNERREEEAFCCLHSYKNLCNASSNVTSAILFTYCFLKYPSM